MATARGVIFDMDGVLVLSGEAHFASWQDVGRRHGVAITRELFESTFGRTNPDCIRIMIDPDASKELIREIADEKERQYRDLVRAAIPLAPRATEVLAALRDAGFTLAVGSSAPRENLDLVLDGARIREFFAAVVDSSMVRRGKPDPDVFLIAARNAGVEPARCVVVEDAPAGIEAARAASMLAIAIASTHPRAALAQAGAHVVLQTLAELRPGLVDASLRARSGRGSD